MQVDVYGWPAGALVRRTYSWPQRDPEWVTSAKEDTGYILDPARLALEAAFYSALLWLVLCGPGVLRWWRRRRRGRCVQCGYNLTGNISGRCPECGTPAAGRMGA
jgi:hypothetical protein